MRTLLAAVAFLSLASGCAGIRLSQSFRSAPEDWIMQGGGSDRRHVTTAAPPLPWERIWEYNAQGGILASPLVRDSIVIVATLHGELQALDLRTGKRFGYEKLGGPIRGTPALNGITAFVPLSTDQASLIAFDLRENRSVWKATVGPIEAAVLLEGSDLFVATLEGNVLCFDARSGEERWKTGIGPKKGRKPIRSGPAFGHGVVVVGTDEGTVAALKVADGSILWTENSLGSIFAGPTVVNDIAVVGDLQGEIMGLDIRTGAIVWKRNVGSPIYGTSSSDGVSVFVPTSSGTLFALEATTGHIRWTFQGASVLNAAPLVAGGQLLVPSLDRTVTVLEIGTGRVLDRIMFDGRVKVSPIVWRGYVIVVSEDKFVSAFVHKETQP